MVVAYKVHQLSWKVFQRLRTVKWVSLVNLVADREVVPEVLQDRASADELATQLRPLLDAADPRTVHQREGLALVRERLGHAGASNRIVTMAGELLDSMRLKLSPRAARLIAGPAMTVLASSWRIEVHHEERWRRDISGPPSRTSTCSGTKRCSRCFGNTGGRALPSWSARLGMASIWLILPPRSATGHSMARAPGVALEPCWQRCESCAPAGLWPLHRMGPAGRGASSNPGS